MKKLTVLLLITIFVSSNSYAYKAIDVCATYSNTGKIYAVEAKVYDGNELNKATSTFNYKGFSSYAVIF